ncbi:hypothetical protein [Homoserinibacter sp. YIM 151385]|uniref:hypothetical protein n=1 Tax=Homoserinibacter sp. YIM 151385 TaxID=2985506 RepID=UPI0022F010C4|nr:hypothetical protein [Homoserinibacter sp. YIM 151385]WBU38184.1 hypothetical protein OF852_00960 [Homoserinibacter sp. YIM 151385]
MEKTTSAAHPVSIRPAWGLGAALGALALVRPLASILGPGVEAAHPALAIGLTIAISAAWILVVGLGCGVLAWALRALRGRPRP